MHHHRPSSSVVWSRILAHAGQSFATRTGLPFTYTVRSSSIVPDRTGYPLHRSNFDAAYAHVPIAGPGEINSIVRGPAYVWAILHDSRVRQNDW